MKRDFYIRYFTVFVMLFCMVPFSMVDAQQSGAYTVVKRGGADFIQYQVSRGEGLYAICRKFGVSQEELLTINPDIKNGLKVDQQLYIPVRKTEAVEHAYEESGFFYHTVEQGETLFSIARSYGVDVNALKRLNPGNEGGIKVGLMLKIPQVNDLPSSAPKMAKEKSVQPSSLFHTIAPKETLFSVSKKYTTTVAELLELNPGLTSQNFSIGKVIKIPNKKSEDTIVESSLADSSVRINHPKDSLYTVEKRETLFGISKKFNVEMSVLLNANPKLRDGVKEGMQINIPLPVVASSDSGDGQESAQQEMTQQQISDLIRETAKAKPQKKINVALLLPFMVDQPNHTDSYRFVEFYEGFLLAVEQIKKEGTSVSLHVFDVGTGTAGVNQILKRPEMASVDLIVGPMYNEQISMVSNFSVKNKKMMVVPFTSKNDDVLNNPYLFQINTPQSYFYSEVAQGFCDRYKEFNVVFLDDKTVKHDKDDFMEALKSEMGRVGLKYKTYETTEDTIPQITDYIVLNKRNVIIPTTGSSQFLSKYMPALRLLGELQVEYDVSLFGYPEWQLYTKDFIEAFYILNTTIYSAFFIDNKDDAFKKFYRDFASTYTRDLRNTFPKYGVLGYDLGMYFMRGWNKYGNNFHLNAQNVHANGLQTGFSFERVNNWSGYINKKVFFVNYHKDFRIEKIELKN